MKLKHLQESFMAYLTEGNREEISDAVVDQGNIDKITRLNIYANAYRLRLRETIETDHPILGTYLGDDLFNQMVQGYIDGYPSYNRSLRYFAERLPKFLADTSPFSEHPIIADIARFERALLHAFDAADAERVTIQNLQSLPPEDWPTLKLRFHPSAQLFETNWNSVESWQALKTENTPPAAEEQRDCSWLLWRNREKLTEFISLPPHRKVLLTLALDGADFSALCEALLNFIPEDDISREASACLVNWIEIGLIRQLITNR